MINWSIILYCALVFMVLVNIIILRDVGRYKAIHIILAKNYGQFYLNRFITISKLWPGRIPANTLKASHSSTKYTGDILPVAVMTVIIIIHNINKLEFSNCTVNYNIDTIISECHSNITEQL